VENKSEVYIRIAQTSECTGALGIRGKGKSWVLTVLMEIAALSGWNFIVFDTKGDDLFLDQPATGWQAKVLEKKYGLKPRGWDTVFYTFNFPYGLNGVPVKFNLAPITFNMIGFGHLKKLGNLLTTTEKRLLVEAYLSNGGPYARLEDVIKYVVDRKKDKAGLLLALLTSGFFADDSPLHPSNLLQIALKHHFTVINTTFLDSSVEDLGYFGTLVTINALKNYLKTLSEPTRLAVAFREMGETTKRYGSEGPLWHLAREIESFIRIARQSTLVVTKLFWEAQDVKDVPHTILHNTEVLFVHPTTLLQESQYKELKAYFEIPSSLMRKVESIGDPGPGFFIMLTKSGDWLMLPFPPPLSKRVREISGLSEKEIEEEMKHIDLPRMDIKPLLEEAITRYKMWAKGDELILEPTDVAVELRLSKPTAALLYALRHAPVRRQGMVAIPRRDLSSFMMKKFGESMAMLLGPAKLIPALRKSLPLLRAMHVNIGRGRDGDLVFGYPWEEYTRAYDQIEDVVEFKLGLVEVMER